MPHLFKVLMLGEPETLKEYICHNVLSANTESFTHSPKYTLGVSFHAAKLNYEGQSIHWQICDIYEKHRWISKFLSIFATGTTGIIIVIDSSKEESFKSAREWLQWFSEKDLPITFPILILEVNDSSTTEDDALCFYGQFLPLLNIEVLRITADGVNSTILSQLAGRIFNSGAYISGFDGRAFWTGIAFWKNSDPQVVRALISNFFDQIDHQIQDNVFIFKNKYGRFEVSLRSGDVHLLPAICPLCQNKCSKRAYICIQTKGQGWTNYEYGPIDQRALLIVAKIYAIINEDFNASVISKIHAASQCSHFKSKIIVNTSKRQRSKKRRFFRTLGFSNSDYNFKFLEELETRYREGKISEEVYNFHRNRLRKQ
ncbi:MAG: hypothetical protein ACFFBD_04040 [Candidatus Hodarchaeota archaeon]